MRSLHPNVELSWSPRDSTFRRIESITATPLLHRPWLPGDMPSRCPKKSSGTASHQERCALWVRTTRLVIDQNTRCHRTRLIRTPEHELHRTTTGTTVLDKDHIVLLPKPSRSPADPLNWSPARRWAILFTMCFYALAADFAAGGVAPAIPIMEFQFVPHVPITKLTQLVAVSGAA
jgi:hypothetical protein